jgi:hypothetical protein
MREVALMCRRVSSTHKVYYPEPVRSELVEKAAPERYHQ